MSTIEHDSNTFAGTANKAATIVGRNLGWGADAVSNIARQTADHVERATNYVQRQSQKIKRQATQLSEKATEHPAYTLLAVGAIGFAVGYLFRGSREAPLHN